MNSSSVALIFLGGVLTFLATGSVELLKNYSIARRVRKNFKIFLSLELTSLSEILNKIKTRQSNNGFYDFDLMALLDSNVTRIDQVRIESVNLNNEDLQRQYFKLVNDLLLFAKGIRGIQQFHDNEQKRIAEIKDAKTKTEEGEKQEKFDTRLRSEKAVELVELQRKLDELLESIK